MAYVEGEDAEKASAPKRNTQSSANNSEESRRKRLLIQSQMDNQSHREKNNASLSTFIEIRQESNALRKGSSTQNLNFHEKSPSPTIINQSVYSKICL